MAERAILAAAVAGLCGAVAVGLCRQLALATGFLDRPGQHKEHHGAVPYLGGIGIVAGFLAGAAVAGVADARWAAVIGAGVVLAGVGLLDDGRGLGRLSRLAAQTAAAVVAVAFGARLALTGVGAIDVPVTVVWIVLITNAVNMLDNMDGLAAGFAVVSAVGSAIVVGSAAPVIAALCLAMAAASAAFLGWNMSTRRIFMGDAGSLFTGFLLAVLSIEAAAASSAAAPALTAVLLVLLAAVDLATVVSSRWLSCRAVSLGGQDHLSHRLVRRGLSPRRAVPVLWAVQSALMVLAITRARWDGVTLATSALAAALVVGLGSVTWRQPVYPAPVTARSYRLRPDGPMAALVPVLIGTPVLAFGLAASARTGDDRPLRAVPEVLAGLTGAPGAAEIAVLAAAVLLAAVALSRGARRGAAVAVSREPARAAAHASLPVSPRPDAGVRSGRRSAGGKDPRGWPPGAGR